MSKTVKNAEGEDLKAPLRARRVGGPRKKVRRQTWRRAVKLGLAGGMIGGLAAGGWFATKNDMPGQLWSDVKWRAIALFNDAGFVVDEIYVTGRAQTARPELLEALALSRGAPIMTFDVRAARERVEALPWVKQAVIERMLPNTVMLHIEEREALALWQYKGQFRLIDTGGEVILKDRLERFSDFPIVVGEDAPAHARALLNTIKGEPDLAGRVEAAVRVGGRRWTLKLKGGIDVQLPETGAADAWSRLAAYEREHKVLARNIQVLDLRLPDRLIVREAPSPSPPKRPAIRTGGRET